MLDTHTHKSVLRAQITLGRGAGTQKSKPFSEVTLTREGDMKWPRLFNFSPSHLHCFSRNYKLKCLKWTVIAAATLENCADPEVRLRYVIWRCTIDIICWKKMFCIILTQELGRSRPIRIGYNSGNKLISTLHFGFQRCRIQHLVH